MEITELNSNEIKLKDLKTGDLFKFSYPNSLHNITNELCLKSDHGYIDLKFSKSYVNSSCDSQHLKKLL